MTTALKIEQLLANNSCQMNVSELKQVVGGNYPLAWLENLNKPNTPEGIVNSALLGAHASSYFAGDQELANELAGLWSERIQALASGQEVVTQIVASQP